MSSSQNMIKTLKRLDTAPLQYLGVLNCLDEEIPHLDIDILVILRAGPNTKLSQYDQLRSFIESFRAVTKNRAYAFSSFRHQMYFTCELRKMGIEDTPIHLLVYPGSFYLHLWEIPSRIRSMLRTSQKVYRSSKWSLGRAPSPTEPYQPFVFLQVLYEAYILWVGANIESEAVRLDVLKKLEFVCKNLAIEALLKTEGMTKKFNTSWKYLNDHLSELEQEGVPIQAVERAWNLKRHWGSSYRNEDVESYFDDTFHYYDALVSSIFA